MNRGKKLSTSLGVAVITGEAILFTGIEAMRHNYKSAAVGAVASIVGVCVASKLCTDAEGELVDKYNNLANDYNEVGQKYNDLQDEYNDLLGDYKELAKNYTEVYGFIKGFKESLEKKANEKENEKEVD